jgi:hypothetical protein
MEKAMVIKGTFVFGLIAAILGASAISIVVSTQLVIGPQGTRGPQAQGHYQPDYGSGWMNISTKTGQYFNIIHNLNSADLMVDITGKTQTDGGAYYRYFGLTGYVPGWNKTCGEDASDAGYSVVRTSDGSYKMVGRTFSFGVGGDAWLIKTDVEGGLGLAWTDSTANTITLYRGRNDIDWNFVWIRIQKSISLS